jgi:hypothetical protein
MRKQKTETRSSGNISSACSPFEKPAGPLLRGSPTDTFTVLRTANS